MIAFHAKMELNLIMVFVFLHNANRINIWLKALAIIVHLNANLVSLNLNVFLANLLSKHLSKVAV